MVLVSTSCCNKFVKQIFLPNMLLKFAFTTNNLQKLIAQLANTNTKAIILTNLLIFLRLIATKRWFGAQKPLN